MPSESAYDPGAHLTYSDVSIDDPEHPTLMKLRLKASKTDPFRKGVDIVMGRTYNELCPIEAMLAFLAIRGNKQGFLFTFADGRLLTKDRFVTQVRTSPRGGRLGQEVICRSFIQNWGCNNGQPLWYK